MEHSLLRKQILMSACLGILSPLAMGQYSEPADRMIANSAKAMTWKDELTHVVMLEGPARIELDNNILSADNVVMWITDMPKMVGNPQRVEIALLGNAVLEQPNGIKRTGWRLYVDTLVRGEVRLQAGQRVGGIQEESDLYKQGLEIRPKLLKGADTGRWIVAEPDMDRVPTEEPKDRFRPTSRVSLSMEKFDIAESGGKIVAISTGKVTVVQKSKEGDLIELMADKGVLFTPFTSLGDIKTTGEQIKKIEEAVEGVYLEGDVRIIRTPADMKKDREQRLEAEKAYYDFTTDRAVLTEVVLHSVDPATNVPLVMRANSVRQLSRNEYTAEKANITISSFNTPSFSIGASKAYVRQTDQENPVTGARTSFVTRDATFRLWNTPAFYLPVATGSFTQNYPLRDIGFSSSSNFGFGVTSQWGLFESIGRIPPKGTDITYRLDYFSERGPAAGLDADYIGGHVDQMTLDPKSYSGKFNSYFVYDHGEDDLGRKRLNVEPDEEFRGRLSWQHQQFFDNWQIQATINYLTDPTFLEEWFRSDFRDSSPLETSLYAKYQENTEAFTALVSGQINDFVTTAGQYQEQADAQHLGELGYYRIGDTLMGDTLTFFSANTLSALQFKNSDYSLAELGFAPASVGRQSPGYASYGQTGTPEDTTYRGDFRQEVDWPIGLGRLKAVPYVIGRYSDWSRSVEGGSTDRYYVGGGMRLSTEFWKTDDAATSELFDIHRIRHVVEPVITLHGAASTRDSSELLIYDEEVENISDSVMLQVALNNRWQTKRGGPGAWRSVDFFKFNLEGNFYFNQPEDQEIEPTDFRGLFFVSRPENSIPRNSLNAEYEWRISDVVSIPGDVQFNMDDATLATASVGLNVNQDQRLSYYLGLRHIALDFEKVVNGNTFTFESQDLVIFASNYQLSANYKAGVAIGYDVAQARTDRAVLSLTRRFDKFYGEIAFRLDEFQGDNAVFFNIWPEGMEPKRSNSNPGSGLFK